MEKNPVSIPTANGTLKATILNDSSFSGKRPAVLVIHDWTSSMSNYPSRVMGLVDQGYLVLLFDMRGHGETGGELEALSVSDHLNDALAAYDYLLTLENVDPNNISVLGSSYGGYLATLLTAERKVNHLVLSVPANYPDDIFDKPGMQTSQYVDEYRKRLLGPAEGRALAAVHNYQGDLLFIEAENDEQVPTQVMRGYRNAALTQYEYVLIPGADHGLKTPGANEARIQALNEWFGKLLTPPSSS